MVCPVCGNDTPAPFDTCRVCRAALPANVPDAAQLAAGSTHLASAPAALTTALGRYRIIRALGAGGMGQVYLAWDQDLGEHVALKVIRSELSANPEAEERFKRELATARRITHRNVIRIHDTGVVDGIRFISMPYVQGLDLAQMLGRGRLPLDVALPLAQQICEGVAAAHAAGIVHRDLKPANIMVDRAGQAYVMDFGLAYASEAPALSAPGLLLGTADYMAPEQARGERGDHRSDIYAIGVILFQIVTGELPFGGDTPVARLSARVGAPAPDPAARRPDLAPGLGRLIRRCLAADPGDRYQSASDVAAAIRAEATPARVRPVWRVSRRGAIAAAVICLAVAAYATVKWWPARHGPPATPQKIAVAALRFHNASEQPALEWMGGALADVTADRLRAGSAVRVISSDRVSQVMRDLKVGTTATFEPAQLAALSELADAPMIVAGRFSARGDAVHVDATLYDVAGNRTVPLPIDPGRPEEIEAIAARLAEAATRVIDRRPQDQPEPASLPVRSGPGVRSYYEGLELARDGNHGAAVEKFLTALGHDEQFAPAHAALARSYAALKKDSDAQAAVRHAVDSSGAALPRERHFILAQYAAMTDDLPGAAKAYEGWLQISPDDSEVRLRVIQTYESMGAYEPASQHLNLLLRHDPDDLEALFAAGRIAIRSGAAERSLDPLSKALSLAVRLDNGLKRAEALQALGIAYRSLNRPHDALGAFQEALAIRRRMGRPGQAAGSLNELAQVYMTLGRNAEAQQAFEEALGIRRGTPDRYGVALLLNNLAEFHAGRGNQLEAIALFKEALDIQKQLGHEDYQAWALRNIGRSYAELGDYQTATVYLERAIDIHRRLNLPRPMAEAVNALGEIAERLGDYPGASKQFREARDLWTKGRDLKRVGFATYGLARVHESQGHLRAAVDAFKEALGNLRAGEDEWHHEVLAGLAAARCASGDCQDVEKIYADALVEARRRDIPRQVATILRWQAQQRLQWGDPASARSVLDEALTFATRHSDPRLMLLIRLDAATAVAAAGRAREAVRSLGAIQNDAHKRGLRPLEADASIALAELSAAAGDRAQARTHAERVLAIAAKTESIVQLARANFVLAAVHRSAGDAEEASKRLAEAHRLADVIRREATDDRITGRRDVKALYAVAGAR